MTHFGRATRALMTFSICAFLTLCAGCGLMQQARAVPVPVGQCVVRQELFQQHPVAERDATIGDLLSEADANKKELKLCNADKARAWTEIQRQKGAPQ